MSKAFRLLLALSVLRLAAGLINPAGRAFCVQSRIVGRTIACAAELRMSGAGTGDGNDKAPNDISRRAVLSTAGQFSALIVAGLSTARADDDGKSKVVVFGGAGWVGAHVNKILSQQGGVEVVSVSRSSPSEQAAKVEKILGTALPIEYQSLDASAADISEVLKGASAVISLVGVAPGGKNQRVGNGAVNIRIADAAAKAGVGRFVYVGVASELANGPAKFLLGDYLKGKAEAEAAVVKDFSSSGSLVVKPAIIAGGPPGEIRPPGPPGVTPVPVEAVAKAVVAGAFGQFSGSIDGNNAIVSATN